MKIKAMDRPLHILLAEDGSQHAMAAAALLRDLLKDEAARPRSSVTILNVLTPRQISEHEMLHAALDQTRALLEERGIPVETEQVLGHPAEKLLEYAEQHRPDLIVVGAQGLRATLGILLGGVAQQVVEYACCPVLVVRAPYQHLRRILLVTDGSIYSQHVLDYIAGTADRARLPLPPEVDLHLMHVLPPLPSADMLAGAWSMGPEVFARLPVEPSDQAQWQIEEECQGQEILDKAVRRLRSAGWEAADVLLRGDAATEIIEYVKAAGTNLIVAGSRGFGPVKAWLLGSVSRKLVHYAPCSVLIVKGSKIEQA